MQTIHKFPLEIRDEQQITLPMHADLFKILNQNDKLMLYALVETDNKQQTRHIVIIGTGNPISEELKNHLVYIGSVQQGIFVWHVFEKIKGHYITFKRN